MATFDKEDFIMNILEEKVININENTINDYYGFIYITEHISKSKYYIGKKNFNRNWKNYLGSGKYLKRAIVKYGTQDFKRHIVALTKSEEDACNIEKQLINKYNATDNDLFYNIHEGGEGGYTLKGYSELQKEKYKQKMRLVIKNKIDNDEDFRKKISEGIRRVHSTREYKENASKAQKKRYEREEEKIKTSIASKKVWDSLTEEQKLQRINKMIERNKSQEVREMLSEKWSGANNPKYGTIMSEETKKMLADARKESCSKKVYMYDENWKYLRSFDSRAEVKKFLNIKGHTQLLQSLRNKTLYKGYYWSEQLLDGSQTTIERVS